MKSERSAEVKVTQERLKEVLHYDSESGEFTWKVKLSARAPAGTKACVSASRGRHRICVDKVLYFAHRLAWLYVHGVFPEGTIDHRDQNPGNNKIANLRLASDQQNKGNRPPQANSKEYRGVRQRFYKFISQITYKGKSMYLGSFDSPEEAHEAYKAKHLELHGVFSNYANSPMEDCE